jgi:biopolymer transport protein ExbD
MASISTGQAEGGKRALDHEIPLIPFIDLLLCCIMFLLVTAVWNQLSAIQVDGPGSTGEITGPLEPQPLTVQVGANGYTLIGDAGDRVEVPKSGQDYDVAGLRQHLDARRSAAPNERRVVVAADDGVLYADLVLAMDTLVGAGFPDVSVSGAP